MVRRGVESSWRMGFVHGAVNILAAMADDPLHAAATSPLAAPLLAPDAAALGRRLERLATLAEPPWLHGEVARRLGGKLAVIRARPARIVDWWSWAGAGAEVLRHAYPDARLTAAEPTGAMLSRHALPGRRMSWLPARLGGGGRRESRVAALLDADVPPAGADLLWANMVLHAVHDPAALLARWREALAIDGLLMFSCLGPDTGRELQALYGELGWPPARQDLQDMHDIGDQLVQAGFADPVMDMERLTLTWQQPEALLAEVHAWGGNAHPHRHAALRTPRWRKRLLAALEGRRRADGTLALTVEVIYGHAVRPLPRARLQAEATVSLDDMRAMTRAGRRQAHRS